MSDYLKLTARIRELENDLARVTQEHDRSTTMHATAVKERDALAAKLARAEGLLQRARRLIREALEREEARQEAIR